jgi:polyphenol oxidase
MKDYMIVTIDSMYSIFFGDKYTCPVGHKTPAFKNFCDILRQQLELNHIVFQHQVHGVDGWIITQPEQLTQPVILYERDGDFLITNQPNVGIGVLTADCLPIVFYVPGKNIIAVAHAGWRSSVARIASIVIETLQQKYNIAPADVHVLFGPSAKSCCYEVSADFVKNLSPFAFADQVITKHDGKLFFDNPLFNKLLLIQAGVPVANINENNNLCTICNRQFHSYRRTVDKENYYEAQATIIWLKK